MEIDTIGTSWKVTADSYEYLGSTDFMEKGSGLLATYPEAMRIFQNTYLSERDIDDKTAVMFFFNQYGAGGAKDRNADGFMPRDKQFGYMFTQGFATADELYIGVAHELGHGMFSLKHPFDNDYKMPMLSTDNLMDYNDGTHIAKWQWDLIHDPGVIVRVFERDKDAMKYKEPLLDQEYFIRDGKINTQSLVYNYPSIIKMLKTQAYKNFISKLNPAKSNISNLIFETEGPVGLASININFIAKILRNGKEEIRLVNINELNQDQYKKAIIALRVWYIKSDVEDNDIPFAHEFFIHGSQYIDEINKLNLDELPLEQVKSEISRIRNMAFYDRGDENDRGDKDHALFLIGQKKEMTTYLLERLDSMETDTEKISYLRSLMLDINMYSDKENIIKNNGGKNALLSKIEKYLRNDFAKYQHLIFNPLPQKETSLWDIVKK